MHDERWTNQAACRGADTEEFFPLFKEEAAAVIERYCDVCPVKQECRQWAYAERLRDGVLGGLHEDDRLALEKQARRRYGDGWLEYVAYLEPDTPKKWFANAKSA